MTREEIKSIVTNTCKTNNHVKKFRVKLNDGKSIVVRLWFTEFGQICMMGKGRKRYGHELSGYDHFDRWVSLKPIVHNKTDVYKRFMKRAKDGLKMLTESGLWTDIKESIEYFLAMPEDKQRELVNDIMTDCYELFYLQTHNGGKYDWVDCHQVFESFARKNCWKSIAWYRYERQRMSARVADYIKNGENYHHKWENGYDNSVDVWVGDDGEKRAAYSQEYRGCANGHYYLMFDATHAIYYEDD